MRPLLRAEREKAVDLEAWLHGAIRAYFHFLIEDYGGTAGGLPHVRIDATPAQRAVFEEIRQSLTGILGHRLAPEADTAYLTAGAIGIARYVGEQMLRRAPPDPDGAARFAVRLILHGLPAAARKPDQAGNAHRQVGDAMHEGRVDALRLAHHLDRREALQDLFPDDLQLHLGQAVADAAVDAEAEGQVLARPLAVDDEGVRVARSPPRRGCPRRTT